MVSADHSVSSGTDGHGVPTGFDAERLIFLQVTVKDSKGNTVYVSGDRDPNGDVRDAHSLYVHNGELKLDCDSSGAVHGGRLHEPGRTPAPPPRSRSSPPPHCYTHSRLCRAARAAHSPLFWCSIAASE